MDVRCAWICCHHELFVKCMKRTCERQGRHRTPVRRRVKAEQGRDGKQDLGGESRNALRLRTMPSPITYMSSCIACPALVAAKPSCPHVYFF